jgi:hypothetical protein
MYTLIESSLSFLLELDDYSTPDGRRRIFLLTDYMSSSELRALRDSVGKIGGQTLPPGAYVSLQGTAGPVGEHG